ncbi:MAG: metallophosphoesterase [Candidatus Kapabacteria bacterium]|nr:metallophosphoesterase [Candidatus Kapabacteria bacterium]
MNQTGILIFVSVILLIFVAFDTYFLVKWKKLVAIRQWKKLYFHIPLIISIIMLLLFTYVTYGRVLSDEKSTNINVAFMITSIWYLPKIIIVPIMFFWDTIRSFYKLLRNLFTKKTVKSEIPVVRSRRKFVQNVTWSFAGIPFIAAFKGILHTAYDFKVYRIDLPLIKLSPELNGLKIIQISDTHFGSFYSREPLLDVLFTINNLQPDLIFITGDFVNFNPKEMDFGFDIMERMKAKYGIYACLGNHDHYMSKSEHQHLLSFFDDSPVKLLNNENTILNINGKNLNIAGVDNYGSRQTFGDFDKALAGLNNTDPTLLLCHDPTNWDKFIRGKSDVDVTFSGHTHGGQLGFDIMGKHYSPVTWAYKQYAGLYHDSDQYLYVNRGLGMSGPPIRLGVNPEITLFTLKTPEFVT